MTDHPALGRLRGPRAGPRSRSARRIVLRTVVPLAVMGLGGAFLVDEGAGPGVPPQVSIGVRQLACPDPTIIQPRARDAVLPGSVRLDVALGAEAGGDGQVRVAPAASGGVGVSVRERGGWLRLAPQDRGGTGARLVSGRGASAAGLAATVTTSGDGAGPALAACAPPRARSWFAGPSTEVGRDPLLVLANLADTPGQASVRVLTDGPAAPGQDVNVAPGHAIVRRLAAFAPEAAVTAVDVQVRTGRLLTWMVDRSSAQGPFAAPRLVPATAPAARRLVLGGVVVPAGPPAPDSTLVLAAPEGSAKVRISVLTPAGPHVPPGLAGVRVPAAGVTRVSVPLPAGPASALLVESLGADDPDGAAAAAGGGGGAPVVAELGLASGWKGVRTWAGATRLEPSDGRPGLDGYSRGVGLTDPDGPSAGAGTAADAVVTVPPVPAGAAGALVLTAPLGPVTARLDGTDMRLRAGSVTVVAQPTRPPAARLTATGGPLIATAIAGAPPTAGPAGAGTRPRLPRILSAVIPLRGAPTLLDALPAVADPGLPYR